MRTVSGFVAIAPEAQTQNRRARLAWPISRCRSRAEAHGPSLPGTAMAWV